MNKTGNPESKPETALREVNIPTQEMFDFWIRHTLRNGDTDQFHHVNNAVMSSLFEEGRMGVFSAASVKPLMEGANLAIVRLLINFHRELFYPGEVQIGTRIVKVGRTSLAFSQGLFDDAGHAVATADATCVLLNPVKGRAQPVSDALRSYLHGGSI